MDTPAKNPARTFGCSLNVAPLRVAPCASRRFASLRRRCGRGAAFAYAPAGNRPSRIGAPATVAPRRGEPHSVSPRTPADPVAEVGRAPNRRRGLRASQVAQPAAVVPVWRAGRAIHKRTAHSEQMEPKRSRAIHGPRARSPIRTRSRFLPARSRALAAASGSPPTPGGSGPALPRFARLSQSLIGFTPLLWVRLGLF